MRWHDLLVALALMLVIEGVLPFLNPQGAKTAFAAISRMDDRTLRIGGLISMVVGVVLLYLVN